MPSELSGGMARRAALARSIALDPDLIMYDEPFVGQDPITMAVLVKLIKELNDALGITSVIVTHDVKEVLSIADYAYHRQPQGGGTRHTGAAAQEHNPEVEQFLERIARRSCSVSFSGRRPATGSLMLTSQVSKLGRSGVRFITPSAGQPSCCFTRWQANPSHASTSRCWCSNCMWWGAVRRHHSGVGPVHRHGALVAGLQRTEGLRRRAEPGAAGLLSLLRELGPVVTALLFAGRAGSALTAESA
jgi:hypothetical protein